MESMQNSLDSFSCDVIRHYGEITEIDKCQEELVELHAAIDFWKLNRNSINEYAVDIVSEIADVIITTNHIKSILFGKFPELEQELRKQFRYKMERARKVIDSEIRSKDGYIS